jgi:hypothetical protein
MDLPVAAVDLSGRRPVIKVLRSISAGLGSDDIGVNIKKFIWLRVSWGVTPSLAN